MDMDEYFVVEGLDSKRVLQGKVKVNGAKNAVLKIIAASVLFNKTLTVNNAPNLKDVHWLLDILRKMGVESSFADGHIEFHVSEDLGFELDFELAKKLRSSVVLSGPVLARCGKVRFPFPGGDKIGLRPIDLFLEAFEKMGATVKENDEYIEINAPQALHGAEIFFRRQSVTATESLMMAAILAEGKTVLKNAAMEPEIVHLANFLNKSGAKIEGAGTHKIEIYGSQGKFLQAVEPYIVPSDRIETASFLALSSVLAKDVTIESCNPKEMEAVLEYYKYIGLNFDVKEDSIRVHSNKNADELRMADFVTHEYPGFPTDAQAPTVAALTQMSGEAKVFETIFEGRFAYTEALRLMGADILDLDIHRILVKGPSKLHGRTLRSLDIRAGLAYIIAASVAEGESKIEQIFHIDRGYEKVEDRLKGIGLPIKRVVKNESF